MAYTLIGNTPGSGDSVNGTVATWMDLLTPATSNGIIKQAQCYCALSTNVKFKIFKDGGTTWVYVTESRVCAAVSGLNTFDIWLPVTVGDYLAIYYDTANSVNRLASGSATTLAGDVTTTQNKTSWTAASRTQLIQGLVFSMNKPIII